MTTVAVRQRLAAACRLLHAALREWFGDQAYRRYVGRCAERQEVPLDRGRYFAARMEERYKRNVGCC